MTDKAKTTKVTYAKFGKQETYKSDAGNEYTFTFPGTRTVESKIRQGSLLADGTQSERLLDKALLEIVVQGKLDADGNQPSDWAYWDNKVAKKDRKETIKVADHDGTEIEYKLEFPGIEKVLAIKEVSTSDTGVLDEAEYYDQLMQQVIKSPDVDYDYWDAHDGFLEVMHEADVFIGGTVFGSEMNDVIAAANQFVGGLFR